MFFVVLISRCILFLQNLYNCELFPYRMNAFCLLRIHLLSLQVTHGRSVGCFLIIFSGRKISIAVFISCISLLLYPGTKSYLKDNSNLFDHPFPKCSPSTVPHIPYLHLLNFRFIFSIISRFE